MCLFPGKLCEFEPQLRYEGEGVGAETAADDRGFGGKVVGVFELPCELLACGK